MGSKQKAVETLTKIEELKASTQLSLADLIVLAGNVGVEQALKQQVSILPFRLPLVVLTHYKVKPMLNHSITARSC